MRAERNIGHGMDLHREKNGALVLSAGARSSPEIFFMQRRCGVVSEQGEMAGYDRWK